MTEIVLIVLVLMIIAAVISLETTELLPSIVSITAVGLLTSLVFVLLMAPEIAMAEIVVDVLVLVILIRATINKDLTAVEGDREFFGMVISFALIGVILLFSVRVLNGLQQFGLPVFSLVPGSASNVYLDPALDRAGEKNLISYIILNYRAYDTLGGLTALFAAIIGALGVLRLQARKKKQEKP